MWEISSRKPPYHHGDFSITNHDLETLIEKVVGGYREEPVSDTPLDYQELYQRCWNQDMQERPLIDEIYIELNKMLDSCPEGRCILCQTFL